MPWTERRKTRARLALKARRPRERPSRGVLLMPPPSAISVESLWKIIVVDASLLMTRFASKILFIQPPVARALCVRSDRAFAYDIGKVKRCEVFVKCCEGCEGVKDP